MCAIVTCRDKEAAGDLKMILEGLQQQYHAYPEPDLPDGFVGLPSPPTDRPATQVVRRGFEDREDGGADGRLGTGG